MNDEGIHRATYLNFKRKVYDLYIKKYVKCSPHEWVRVLNDIVLPYQKVGEYALSLYIDTRYDSFGEDGRLAEYVTKIQQIYSKACDEGKGENTIEVYKLIFNG